MRKNTHNDFIFLGNNEMEIDIHFANGFFNRYNSYNLFANLKPPIFYLIDYVNVKYAAALPYDSHFLGYTNKYLRDAGPLFLHSRHNADDFNIINKKILPQNLQLLAQHHPEWKDLTFTMNYRSKSRTGEEVVLCQHSSYIKFNADGTPAASMGIAYELNHFKPENNRILSVVEKFNSTNGKTDLLAKNHYFPNERFNVLTRREIEVLKWISEGLSSKQIADKLHVSVYTVNNHRQNMIKKTNCNNLTEIINFAVKSNII